LLFWHVSKKHAYLIVGTKSARDLPTFETI